MSSGIPAFDDLLAMAQDPKQLEAYRQREVQSIINDAPESIRQRLQGLQFQIDAQRELHDSSPLGACIQLSKMMHDSFSKLQNCLSKAAKDPALARLAAAASDKPLPSATIIPFPVNRPPKD